MEFVVFVLVEELGMDADRADALMRTIHFEGEAVVAVLDEDRARSRAAAIANQARTAGFPLALSVRPIL
jgi:ATP-dependent Clp protease adapter protein ClpS